MGLLYEKYSNPIEFMRIYIDQGRFGEFVNEIIKQENERRKQQVKDEEEKMLWIAYVHSYSEKSYSDWKSEVLVSDSATSISRNKDDDMTKEDINKLMNRLFHNNAD